MLPQRIVEFVQGPYAMHVGTRDDKLSPDGAWAFGAVADAENNIVTMFVPDAGADRCMNNMRSNGHVTLLIGHDEAHETYQLKGEFIDARPCTKEEITIQAIYKTKVVPHWKPEWEDLTEPFWDSFLYNPSTAVSFRVTEVFDQTPGPGAGKKIEL